MTHGYHYVRLRRQDHNWVAYPFPTFDAACRFAVGSALDGWETKLEGHMVKSLRSAGKPRKSLKPYQKVSITVPMYLVPEGTAYDADAGHMVTTMADGLTVAWDMCGRCTNHVRVCTCVLGVSAPGAIQYIAYKAAGVAAGQKWEEVPKPSITVDTGPRTSFVHPWRENRGKSLATYATVKPKPIGTPKPGPKPKSLYSAANGHKPTIEIDNRFDLAALDSVAAEAAANATAALTKKLLPRPKKPLR